MGAPATLAHAPVTAPADCKAPPPGQRTTTLVPDLTMDKEMGLGAKVSPRYDVPEGAVAKAVKVVVAAPVSTAVTKVLPAVFPAAAAAAVA